MPLHTKLVLSRENIAEHPFKNKFDFLLKMEYTYNTL